MSYKLEVKYYNSFWLKHITTPLLVNARGEQPGYFSLFPGFPWARDYDPEVFKSNFKASLIYPNWPINTSTYTSKYFKSNVYNIPNSNYNKSVGSNWVIEESRIKGAFNGNTVDLGVRAYLREDSNLAKKRNNALIYSGIFNSNTNVNNTNVFSIAEDITKAVDPHNGSIQLIYAMDNNLTIFQENKVSTALIDKDYIYSAEGQSISTQSDVVIGQVTPYTGEYGISRNPESFAIFGFRRYFSDKDRNAVLRLSRDGITEISGYGMRDYFRDNLSEISETATKYYSSNYKVELINNNISDLITNNNLGNYILIDTSNPLIEEESINGSIVEINLNFDPDNPNTGWITLINKATTIGKKTSASSSQDLVYIENSIINQPLTDASGNIINNVYVRFVSSKYDKIEGGFDNYKDNYIVSIQKHSGSKTFDETSDYYNTLTFDETVQGWTTFYTYRPLSILSLKGNLYTTKENSIYRHYDNSVGVNSFYGADPVASSITFVFNGNPSISKNFKTINYEGTSGWRVDSFSSGETQESYSSSTDQTNEVLSYEEGGYIESGVQYRQGFYRKNNKYYAKLVNNSQASQGEVNFGTSITGIKGFFATVKMSTDNVTDVGGVKELFAASTEFVLSR